MTVEFISFFPSSAEFYGPGYGFFVRSNIVRNPAHDYQWNIRLIRLPTLQRVNELSINHFVSGELTQGRFGVHIRPDDIVIQGEAAGIYGDDLDVRVELDDVTAQVIADGPTTFSGKFLDPNGQLYVVIDADRSSGAGSGNFTDADRALLQAIDTAVVLPTYTSQVTHVGLTADGSLNTLAGTRALRVTVTAFPPNVDRAAGTPQYFFDLGFFTMNVGQGWVKSQRLVFEFQTYEAPEALDSFGWTLTPGTTINVEELKVGP